MGLSQARVSVLIGVSRQALSRIETGAVADLGVDKAERLAQTLGFKLRVVESMD
jgi:transcriptional regulator with XRE-family HTH domain